MNAISIPASFRVAAGIRPISTATTEKTSRCVGHTTVSISYRGTAGNRCAKFSQTLQTERFDPGLVALRQIEQAKNPTSGLSAMHVTGGAARAATR